MPSTSEGREPPRLIQVRRPHEMTPELAAQLITCGKDVTNAGGFPFPPVTAEQVATVAAQLIAGLDLHHSQLLLAISDDTLLGWLSLSRQLAPVVRHWGIIQRVQTPGASR